MKKSAEKSEAIQFQAVMDRLKIDPDLLISYLQKKLEEDRAVQAIHKDIYSSIHLTEQDLEITNAEIFYYQLEKLRDLSL